MEDSIPNRSNRQDPALGPSDVSGETRRLRLSEFHQNKRRAPNFYARANSAGGFPVQPFETHWREQPRQEPVRRPTLEEKKRRGPWIFLLIAALLLGSLAAATARYLIGAKRGRAVAIREIDARTRTMTRLPDADVERLNAAIADLRAGEAPRALDTLKSLREKFPQTASLNYLAALAALQAGDSAAAESFVKESLQLGQRISDSLALQAVLEKGKPDPTGKGKTRAEGLLRAAITADAANSSPHLELAMMLRAGNRREDARREFLAAQSRLNPIDSQAVIETTLALMALEDTKDAALPQPPAHPLSLIHI